MTLDGLLRGCVCAITNTDLTDIQWTQASLPVRNGGLGIRRVSSLAPSAFLASAAGTLDIQAKLLLRCLAPVDSAVDRVLEQWSSEYSQTGVMRPVGVDAGKQRQWDKPCVSADVASLMISLTDRRHQARLLASETGSTLCRFRPAASGWMTRPSESPSVFVSGRNFASRTNAHAASASTRKAPTDWHAGVALDE